MTKNSNMWLLTATTALILTGAATSCAPENDPEVYQKLIEYMSPVDSVDQQHTWQLTASQTFRIRANGGYGAEQVLILTANPVTNQAAEVMAQGDISDGETVALSVSRPRTLNTLYAALVDGSGRYTVTEFSTSQTDVDFSSPENVRQTVGRTLPQQTYTYLFEEDFPAPGDYDYNDLVMRISRERTGKKELTLTVSIVAVGADNQMACGIRLVGFNYSDIDSVKTESGENFSDGVPQGSLYMFDNTDLLIKGQDNEAVINVCVDAHWAMAFNAYVDYGLFLRKKYNVSTSTSDQYQRRSVRTLKYIISFKSELGLSGFTLDSLDPFILAVVAGGKWETHLDRYRDAQVLFDYTTPDFKDLPWALMVPSSSFLYPLEGVEIGFKKNGAMFGAYMTTGHSFGEWAENRNASLDWYNYPTSNQVY